jgi:pimeloyl-ACP methyl ester carboxylesterase
MDVDGREPYDAGAEPIDWQAIRQAERMGPAEWSGEDGFQALRLSFRVPLDHRNQESTERIALGAVLVFGPGLPVLSPGNADSPENILRSLTPPKTKRPILVYLCGGPGSANPAFALPDLNRAILQRQHAILYLDYRGTGDSTPVTAEQLRSINGGGSDAADPSGRRRAAYLRHFTQDAIVADLEAVRLALNGVRFVLLAQSFGGWIATTYLSFLPRALDAVYIAGGVPPPFGASPDAVYSKLYDRVRKANERYYELYPDNQEKVVKVVRALARMGGGRGVELPPGAHGQRLTARGFMTMGRRFGLGDEGLKKVHEMVELFWEDCQRDGVIAEDTLQRFVDMGGTGFRLPERPLYAVLHEAIYCYGPRVRSAWAAQRVGREQHGASFAWLDHEFDFFADGLGRAQPLFFSGEMIYEFMLQDAGPELEPFVLPARALAQRRTWPPLYDVEQLRRNTVPVRALAYPRDLFVDFGLCKQTLDLIGNSTMTEAPGDWIHGSIKTRTKDVIDLLYPMPKIASNQDE